MKKVFCMTIVVAMMLGLIGCGGSKTAEKMGETSAETAETVADEYEGIVLKVSHNMASTDYVNTCLEDAAAKILERTEGKVELQIYPNGELLTYAEAVEAITSDSNVIYYCGFGDWADYSENAPTLASGFVFDSVETFEKFMDTEVFAKIIDELADQNIYSLTPGWSGGFRHLMTQNEVKTMDDIAGQTIRVPNTVTHIGCFDALGMSPVGIAWTETLTNLSTGSIDAVEGTYSTIVTYNMWDYVKVITETSHILQAESLWVSKNVWESIPEEYRAIAEEELETARLEYVRLSQEAEDSMRQQAIDHGMKVTPASEFEYDSFVAAASEFVLQFPLGQEVLDTVASLK